MEFKGTKDKWMHSPNNGVHTPNGDCILLTHSTDKDKRYYDSQLASCAPELVEALQNTLSALECFIGHRSDEWAEVQEAKKVLAKALEDKR